MLAQASGRENCLVHVRRDLSIAVKENTAVFVLQTKLCFLYWKFDLVRFLLQSMHHFIIRVVSLLSSLSFITLFNKTKRIQPQIRMLIFARKTKKFLRWRTASTSIKLRQNNDRTTARFDSVWSARTPEIGQR